MEAVVQTVQDTHEVAQNFLDKLTPEGEAVVVGLVGLLGAGKTEFVRGLLRAAGIDGVVNSPTYTLETVYQPPETDFEHIYHIDAYRLENGEDLLDIGFSSRLKDDKSLILVEWADKVESVLPSRYIEVDISFADTDKNRDIIITKHNE